MAPPLMRGSMIARANEDASGRRASAGGANAEKLKEVEKAAAAAAAVAIIIILNIISRVEVATSIRLAPLSTAFVPFAGERE